MQEYIANGAELGWLLDPQTRSVEVYRPGRDPELLTGTEAVRGEGPVGSFSSISAPNGIPSRYNSNATCCRASGRVSAGDPLLMARNHLGQ